MSDTSSRYYFCNIFYIFLLIQPILDLLTSLMVRFTTLPLTIGMIIRGLFLFGMIIYLVFINKSVHKKKSLIYLAILCIFSILYIITKNGILSLGFLKTEVIYLFKYMYFPITALCLINVFDEVKLEKEKIFKICIIEALLYSILIIMPEITNTAFSSYLDDNKGTVGWFYAANEIGAIMVALFPFLYYLLFEREGIIKIALIFTIVILAMTLLGTKTSFLGMLITEIIYALYFLFNFFTKIQFISFPLYYITSSNNYTISRNLIFFEKRFKKMKNEKILNLSKNKKTFQSIIETIIDNEKVIKIIENNYYQKSMQDIDNADVNINHLENIFTNETYYLAMKIVPLLERKVLYLSYIENCRLNDICKKLKLGKNEVISLRSKAINHFKHNLEILYKSEKLKKGSKNDKKN